MASYCEPYRHATTTGHNPDGSENIDVPGATVQSAYCWGAFALFQDLSRMIPSNYPAPYLPMCTPPHATRLELLKVFLRFMDEHPERGHEPFGWVLSSAIWAAYPRPTSEKGCA
jgi:hypothetical protein